MWILPLALLVVYLGSPRFLGTMASSRVRRMLDATLEKRFYTPMHDLTLTAGGGTVHFDHIVVSQFGIHVIDSLSRSGWISGTESQVLWRQKTLVRSSKFENPVHANFLRVQALERLLQLPLSRFHPLMLFGGHEGFRTTMPKNVIDLDHLIRKIRADTRQALSPEEADRAVLKIQNSIVRRTISDHRGRWKLLRMLLFMGLVAAVYFVYGGRIESVLLDFQKQANVSTSTEKVHPVGVEKTAIEIWEESLICAYSVDTQRCACYEPAGTKAQIQPKKCQELAQKDSVLQR